MGRRHRRRTIDDRLAPPPPATQTARVRVSDEMWADFRRAIGDRHISEALGELVEREVQHWQTSRLDANVATEDVEAMVRRLGELERSCRALIDRLGDLSARASS